MYSGRRENDHNLVYLGTRLHARAPLSTKRETLDESSVALDIEISHIRWSHTNENSSFYNFFVQNTLNIAETKDINLLTSLSSHMVTFRWPPPTPQSVT
ncbi:hypothetical protein EVAR_77472_1 [Eumeta japonica]|uniref:Uncharacterized protein n=1 Tax=Eumeta variegata TaxID=151549 RepID=A0A4C1T6A5_EUMVA|nr:hypothetical protein EVAR_77472_1 [Eumeta japonica]